MNNIKHLNIQTELGENEFQIRVLKDEEIGLLTTKNGRNYLILDSLDYWYDSIQEQYPKKTKCSCKNEWFTVQFNYLTRQISNDFKEIDIYTTCTHCHKKSNIFTVNIDYSPTDELYNQPITYCEKPNIKYKLKELTSYWLENDLIAFLSYMYNHLQLNGYVWFFNQENKRKFEQVSFEQALKIIQNNYLDFIFSYNELDMTEITMKDDNGVYISDNLWKKNEIIKLSSPLLMADYGLLYYISFCNQYLDNKGTVINKSKSFEHTTQELVDWLKSQFITQRGKNCFDGQDAYNQFITNFTK